MQIIGRMMNRRIGTFTVAAILLLSLLLPTMPHVLADNIGRGGTFTVTIKCINAGDIIIRDVDARTSDPWVTHNYVYLGDLAPGESQTAEFHGTVPLDAPLGIHTVTLECSGTAVSGQRTLMSSGNYQLNVIEIASISTTVNPPQIQPWISPNVWIKLDHSTVQCNGVLTGVLKVKNTDTTRSIHVQQISLRLAYYSSAQEEYVGWSWSGNDEIKQYETGTYPWISSVKWNFPTDLGETEVYAIVYYTSPAGTSESYTTTRVPFAIDCPQATTTFTHKENVGSTTMTEVSTETTSPSTSENCFSYLLDGNWDEFWGCLLGVSPCFIATATYGSPLAPQVQLLRDFRDRYVLNTFSGKSFMLTFNAFYYSFSPQLAALISSSPMLRQFMQVALAPLLAIMEFAYYVNLQLYPSNSEVAIILSGLVLCCLVGLVYLSPFAALLAWRSRTCRRSIASKRMRRLRLLVVTCLIGSVILSTILRLPFVTSLATSLTAVVVVGYAGLLPTQLWLKLKTSLD